MIPPRRSRIDRGPLPGRAAQRRFFSLAKLRLWLRTLVSFFRFMMWPVLRAYWSRKDLRHVMGSARGLRRKGLVVVAAHYGDHGLVQPFLNHHRWLGAREFVFLDLSSDQGLAGHLAGASDCAVWTPPGLWRPHEATHWLNALRCRYASGRWCLSIDTSDAFVFYRCETRRIGDLTDFLETESRDHIYALIIEMYGAAPASTLRRSDCPKFLDVLPYFDPCGFTSTEPGDNRDVVTRGGLQRRLLYKSQPRRSPALNRIPLVKWQWYYSYLAGTRLILPSNLNTPHVWWHSNPTACLLRFALLAEPPTLKVATEVEAHAIVGDESVPAYAGLAQLLDRPLHEDFSRRYSGTSALVETGLLNPGQWF